MKLLYTKLDCQYKCVMYLVALLLCSTKMFFIINFGNIDMIDMYYAP